MSQEQVSIIIRRDASDIPTDELLNDDKHLLDVSMKDGDVFLKFSSRESLVNFATTLLHKAFYGRDGALELYPLIVDEKALVVNGARLTEDSCRIFITYPKGSDL
jgi:hypothetical protein